MRLEAGTRVGPYEIRSLLGSGGMGEVYRAHDTRLDRDVAVKVLPESLALDPDRLRRFEQEARALAALSHPNILSVFDIGTLNGSPYLVFELLEGTTLRTLLAGTGLSVRKVLEHAAQIAGGLGAAHDRGIIHRDLKPENIFVTTDGRAKILDFGLARLTRRSEDTSSHKDKDTLTSPSSLGTIVGTAGYMSPEQVRGEPIDARSDIFSFGAMLYEMLAGRRAFHGASPAETLSAILRDDPPSLLRSDRRLPAGLEAIVTRCLEKVVNERFRSAYDLALALQALSESPGRAPDVGAGVETAGSQALGEVSASALASKARGASGRSRWPLWAGTGGALIVLALVGAWLVHGRRELARAAVSGPKRLAVLPFENQGTPETDYFAEGMSDEVRGKLASLSGFAVVASTSSNQYKKTTKPIEQVARELDVSYLVVGKVRRQKAAAEDRVQVIPELVEVQPSGAQLEKWRQPFDATLTDVFRVQAEIAGKVAQALDVTLSAGQQKALAEQPTRSLAAYDAFLRGENAYYHFKTREAAAAYEQAVTLDPKFALAWAHLSRVHSAQYFYSPTPEDARLAREAAERAIALAPDGAAGYEAHAKYISQVERDKVRAFAEIERAASLAPYDVEVLRRRARFLRGLGRWDEAVRQFEEAKQVDPRSPAVAEDIIYTLIRLRRFGEAKEEGRRLLDLDPTRLYPLIAVALGEGDLAEARGLLRGASKEIERAALLAETPLFVLDDEQQSFLLALGPDRFGPADRANFWELRGDRTKAREYFAQALPELEGRLRAIPDPFLRAQHASLLAHLGRKAEAIAEGEKAAAIMPVTRDADLGTDIQQQLLETYLAVGENEKALDQIEALLKIPSELSPGLLRIDPTFAPLRTNPRFEKVAHPK